MKALVVDDSRAMRIIIGRTLSHSASRSSEAANGREALDAIADEGPFELVLVDWNMPVMDGFELVLHGADEPGQRRCGS